MIAQTRFLGRNKGLAAQKKKQAARRKSKGNSPTLGEFPYAQNDYSVIFGGERKKLDPYAIPKKEEQPKQRIILSQDPIIRVMIENNSDIKYEEAMKEEEEQSKADSSTLSPSSTHTVQGVFTKGGGPRTSSSTFSPTASSLGRRGSSSTLAQRFQHFVSVAREKSRNRLFKGDRAHPQDSTTSRTNGTGTSRGGGGGGGAIVRFSTQESGGHQVPKVVIDGLSPTLQQRRTLFQTKARNLNCCASFGSQGRVTSGCLWHAFRAITLGVLLIAIGITMAILGFLDDQRNLQQKTLNKSMSVSSVIASPGPPTTTLASLPPSGVPNATTGTATTGPASRKRPGERSKLNDQRPLAFSPGLTRQDRFKLNNLSFAGPVVMGVGGFLIVAACVMTFEARDNAAKVVPSTNSAQNEEKAKTRALKFRSSSSQTTFLDRNIVETLHVDPSSGSSVSPRGGNCKVLSAVGASAQVGVGSAAAATAGLFDLQNTFRPLAVPSNLNISGSTYSTKRASFNGKLPAASDFEPGLALMDEIGRRALTNAFIQFTRNTSNPSAYRDSLIYNIQPSQNYPKEDDGFRGSGHLEVGQAIPKCPSAPDIAHHKLDHNVTMSGHVVSHRQKECVDGQVQGDSSSQQPEYEPLPTLRGQYRVLTPTMYRSRMAATRQAISMDCEGSNTAKTRREGPSLRIPSPFQNPIRKFAQDSLDLELGASATGVHNLANRGAAVANSSSTEGHTAKSSNQSQRESREIYEEHSNSSMLLDLHLEGSAPVTLLVRDESRSTRSTSGNREAGSNNRSPPSLHEQMSCERLKLSCSRSNSNSSSSSSSSSLPKQEETSIFGGSGSVEQEEDEEAEREAAHFDDHNEKRIRDRRKSFRQSKMRQKKHARQTRQRRNSDPSFDSSFDAGKDDASRMPDHCQRHHPQIASPSTLSDDDDEELLVVDSLHQATVTLKSQSSQLNVKFDVAKGPEIPTPTVLQQNLEAVEGIGLEDDDNNSINNRMQTILEEDAAVTISLVGALGAVGKKHFQGQKASKSCDDPVVTPPTPFGSYKRQERWSKSLAEEMATLSFIDTSPIEERENKPPRTVPSNMRASSSDHYHYYYHHHRSPPSTRHDQREPNVSQSFASLASEEETSSPDEGGTLKRNNKVQTGFRSDYRSGEGAGPMRAQSTSAYSKSEPLLYAAKIYDPEEEELFLDIAEDSISLSPEAFPVTYSAELPPPPKPFDDHMLRGTIDPRSEDRTRSNLEQCQPMSVPLVGSCPRSHEEKRSGIEAHSSTIDTQTSTRVRPIESKDKYSVQF